MKGGANVLKAESWCDFKNEINIESGYAIIMFIDKFEVIEYPFNAETEEKLENCWNKKLLDIRIFNNKKEYRVFRADAGSDFIYCYTDDSFTNDYYDDEQYLDIDSTKIKPDGTVTATGGGEYKLPLKILGSNKYKGEVKLYIRNYIDYDNKFGQAYIKRWRITDIRKE